MMTSPSLKPTGSIPSQSLSQARDAQFEFKKPKDVFDDLEKALNLNQDGLDMHTHSPLNREEKVLREFVNRDDASISSTIKNGAYIGFGTGILTTLIFGPTSHFLNQIDFIKNMREKRLEIADVIGKHVNGLFGNGETPNLEEVKKSTAPALLSILGGGLDKFDPPYKLSIPLNIIQTGLFGALAGSILSYHLVRNQKEKTNLAADAIHHRESLHKKQHPEYEHRQYLVYDSNTDERELKHVAVASPEYREWKDDTKNLRNIFNQSLIFNFFTTTALFMAQGVLAGSAIWMIGNNPNLVKQGAQWLKSQLPKEVSLFNVLGAVVPEVKQLGQDIQHISDEHEIHRLVSNKVNNLFMYNALSKFGPINLIRLATLGFITSFLVSLKNARQIYKTEDQVGYRPVEDMSQLQDVIEQVPNATSDVVSRNRGERGDFHHAVFELYDQLMPESRPLVLPKHHNAQVSHRQMPTTATH